jgi:outer membrane lipopolysaccharide assembly protein LptE/RlpB
MTPTCPKCNQHLIPEIHQSMKIVSCRCGWRLYDRSGIPDDLLFGRQDDEAPRRDRTRVTMSSEIKQERFEIGRMLRETRKAANIGVAELYRQTGVPQSVISQVENGQLGEMSIRRVAEALGVNL